jgi:hypothetical protein
MRGCSGVAYPSLRVATSSHPRGTLHIPFSYDIMNSTSQFLTSIPAVGQNTSIRLGGTAPSHTPFSFGGTHVLQMTPIIGGFPPFNPRSNPIPNTSRWSNQIGGQATSYGLSFTPTSSVPIPTNGKPPTWSHSG